ncbi:MAG: heavy metal translocating P-type ATPase [Flavonifractor plautii]
MRRDITFLALGGGSLLLSFFAPAALPVNPAWLAILLCGAPIVREAAVGLFTRFDIKADVLVSLALLASVAIGEIFAAGEIAFIMQLGSLLEERTVAKARAGIEKLVRLTPRTARRVTAAGEESIPAEAVAVGDRLRVLPGETIPVDGVVRAGQTSVNQAVMTGESLPVDKGPGDEVFSGTVNQFGSFEMEAARVGEDSSIQRMIRLVQSADAGKAKIVGLADRWATWIVVAALASAALTWLLSGQVIRAVTILVVFCPCALVLATPTAIMAAIGNATRHSFLVREGDALERLAQVGKAAFDKTGTLTRGVPEVTAVRSLSPGVTEEQVYAWLARAELGSEHPLGKAVVRGWQAAGGGTPAPPAEDFEALLEEAGAALPPAARAEAEGFLARGCTLIYLAVDGAPAGFCALADTVRGEAAAMLRALSAEGVSPVLLTGDNENAAAHIARTLSIREYRAGCLPEDKLNWIDRAQQAGVRICMVGDGINDAPALKRVFVGIAMGGVGSDIAVDAADIVLVNDRVEELPHLLALSRRMMTTIRLNLAFSMALNLVAIVLAMTGVLNPVVGALVHNAGSVLVILNSALLLKWRRRS